MKTPENQHNNKNLDVPSSATGIQKAVQTVINNIQTEEKRAKDFMNSCIKFCNTVLDQEDADIIMILGKSVSNGIKNYRIQYPGLYHDFGSIGLDFLPQLIHLPQNPKMHDRIKKIGKKVNRLGISLYIRHKEQQNKILLERLSNHKKLEGDISLFLKSAKGVSIKIGDFPSDDIYLPYDALLTFINNAISNSIHEFRKNQKNEEEDIQVQIDFGDGKCIVEITDNGPGVEGDANKIFMQGYTTKGEEYGIGEPQKHGTGLKRLPRIASMYQGVTYTTEGHGGIDNAYGNKGLKLKIGIPYYTHKPQGYTILDT